MPTKGGQDFIRGPGPPGPTLATALVQTAAVHGCRASILLILYAVARGVHGAAHRVPVAACGPELVKRPARRDP